MQINSIISNIQATGGISINNKNITPKTGFMVSIQGYEKQCNINDTNTIKNYLNKNKNKLNKYYFGAWLNDNKLYLDISKNYKYFKNAIKAGIKNNQLAIFNLNTNESVVING